MPAICLNDGDNLAKKVFSRTGMNITPWIVAGDPGRVDIIWYHTARS